MEKPTQLTEAVIQSQDYVQYALPIVWTTEDKWKGSQQMQTNRLAYSQLKHSFISWLKPTNLLKLVRFGILK